MAEVSFDDLIPAKGQTRAPSELSFDDLVPAKPSVAADVAKQLGSGAVEAVPKIFTGDALFDPLALAGRGAIWAANKIAPENEYVKNLVGALKFLDSVSTPPNKDPMSISSALPSPQTTAGQFARPIGAATVGMLAGGASPASALIRGTVSGGASEALGQAADKFAPEYAPAARVTGSMLGTGGRPAKPATTAAKVVENAGADLDKFRDADVTLDQAPVIQWAKKQQVGLKNDFLDDQPAFKSLDTIANSTEPVPLGRLQQLRARMVKDASSTDGAKAQAALNVKDAIDDFIPSLQAKHVVNNAQNLPEAQALWQRGITNYGVGKTAEMLEKAKENARINNAAAHTGDNVNAIRQQVKPLLKNARMRSRFGPELAEQLEGINEGSPKLNFMRRVGSFVNGHNNFLPFLMGQEAFRDHGGLVGLLGGMAMGGAAKATGVGLNKLGFMNQADQLNEALNSVFSRGIGLPKPKPTLNPIVAKALAATTAARGGQ